MKSHSGSCHCGALFITSSTQTATKNVEFGGCCYGDKDKVEQNDRRNEKDYATTINYSDDWDELCVHIHEAASITYPCV